ncbi:MAG: metallophosphoesterase [Candidatus Nealsonbacteria bacterium]|nr:metallophosphoesterase [Candidatus Nealsonbacteria bacterium]
MSHRQRTITRRRFTAVAAGAIAGSGIAGRTWGQADPPDNGRPFFFIVAADPQLFWGPVELWKKAVGEIGRLKPALTVVCGDLIQDPGNEEQARAYLDPAKALDGKVPLYNLAGNHDVGSPPTPESLAWYEKHFGKPWYSLTHGGCLFVVLDSNLLCKPNGAPKLAEQQLAWLKQTLADAAKAKHAHRFVFLHHPICLKQIDEPNGYFNVPNPRRAELLKHFHDHKVTATFSGHYHRNALVTDGNLQLITTASTGKPLGKDPTGFRIVKVYGNRIKHAYHGYDEMPVKVEL